MRYYHDTCVSIHIFRFIHFLMSSNENFIKFISLFRTILAVPISIQHCHAKYSDIVLY